MRTPLPLPQPFAGLPFTLQEALDAGVTPGRLRHRSLAKPSRGIRIPGAINVPVAGPAPGAGSVNPPALLRAITSVTEFSAVSHASAFVLWDFPGFLPGRDEPGIHVSRPDTMAMPRRKGVVGHFGQFFPDEITSVSGLLVTTRVRTWLDISRKMDVGELTVVADHLLRVPRQGLEGRTEPYATRQQLADMLDRHKGTPGIRKARLALEQARVGADSAPETRLRLALDRGGLPEAELNAPMDLGYGVVRQPDLAYREYRVAVEYEGEQHSEPAQIVRDIAREEDFARAGWAQVRISKRHMANGAGAAVAKVRTALAERGWRQAKVDRR